MGEPNRQQRVALFGGTFDPVHNGHLEVGERAVEALSLDRVIFLPCRQSPHKERETIASEQERLQLLKLATASLPWAEVCDWEYHQPSPSYSWRTAEVFQKKWPSAQLFWLMGWDQWKVLPSWNRFDYLAQLVEFIVHARNGQTGQEVSHPGACAHFVSGNHAASSSQIRALLASDSILPKGWLPEQVMEFLTENSHYL